MKGRLAMDDTLNNLGEAVNLTASDIESFVFSHGFLVGFFAVLMLQLVHYLKKLSESEKQ